jgi:hypothetical protein
MSKEVQFTPLFLGFFIFSMMLNAVLLFMLLLPGMVMAFVIIIETQHTITCSIPSFVSHVLGIQSYTFLKLTNKQLSTEDIFSEYAIGRDGQIPLYKLIQEFANQPEVVVEEYKDWSYSLQLHTREVVAGAVLRVGEIELLQDRVDAHIIVCRILDGIRWTTGWVEFALILVNVEDSVWNGVVDEAFFVALDLPQSFALAVGRDKYRFLKLSSEYTSEETLIEEYENGYGGQISLGMLYI